MRMKNKGFAEGSAGFPSRRNAAPDVAAKKPVNVSLNEELLKEAKAHGINLSQTLERALIDTLRRAKGERWLAENREAIESYNRHIEKHGVFSDGLRRF